MCEFGEPDGFRYSPHDFTFDGAFGVSPQSDGLSRHDFLPDDPPNDGDNGTHAVTAPPDESDAERRLIQSCYAEFGNNPASVRELIKHARAAGYDLTEGNRSSLENTKQILARIAGKDIDGLKFRSVSAEVYLIATLDGNRETGVI